MNASKRIARVLAGVLCVAAVGFIAVAFGLVPGADHAVAFLADGQVATKQLSEQEARGRQLDELFVIEQRAAKAKDNVVAEVIAGRLTLVQAAALFSAAEADLPADALRVRLETIPGATDPERHCRKVICHVEYALADEPSERQSLVNRLTAELENELQRNGTVSLPDSDTVAHRPI